MNLKEFDAKQFLLEKGERVGLGAAVTLMVLMLILSLFWPDNGFFSGSPKTKANELKRSTERLETALRTNMPGDKDKPENREGKLIALDTNLLDPDKYATENWFEPRMKENNARRPPKIYNVEEAVASAAAVPIDTYLFRFNADPPSILVLSDGRGGGGNVAGGMNPFSPLKGMLGGKGSMMPSNPFTSRQQGRFSNSNLGFLQQLQGPGGNADYQTIRWKPLDEWDPNQLTAHQLRPLRMAIIAGSFPYAKQLDEHKRRLRLKSTDDVLSETVGEGEKKSAAFAFRGVEVQRREVDADGNPIGDWIDPQLKDSYQLWLQHTYYPFEEEDPKYDWVRPNGGKGLVMPLLREFHAKTASAPGLSGMMSMMQGRFPQQANPEADEVKTRYPDVAADLPKIQEELEKVEQQKPKQIAQSKFQKAQFGDAFDPNIALSNDKAQAPAGGGFQQGGGNAESSYIPDYVLVRVVDVNIEPGKYYQYRLKIKMTNPNYQREDVASPEYKVKETLESSEWYKMKQIVKVPEETIYYVADDAQGMTRRDLMAIPRDSARYRLLTRQGRPQSDQVVFQFHRWVEATQQSRKDTELIPVGEWAVADRVFVARGEYVGRKMNVDIPIWKYSQNMFILPAEDQKRVNRATGRANTGIDVDFGQDPPEKNVILVDFEGGRVFSETPQIDDECATEVLMLRPDGKLVARNSVKDTNDPDRKKRRDDVLTRIEKVRLGLGTE